MIVKKLPIVRSQILARPYLKCQVIVHFEQQCRLVKGHRTHVGPSALSFFRQGASVGYFKSKILYLSYGREKTLDSQIPFSARSYLKCRVILDFWTAIGLVPVLTHCATLKVLAPLRMKVPKSSFEDYCL